VAKRDKKDEGTEEYEFQVPDFDEDAFIHKEMVSFRTTTILFAWGVVAALVSWGLFVAVEGAKMGWYLGLAVVVATGFLLRYVYRALKVDVSHFGRREWLGTGFLFFFTWLAFFLILVNPPISDFAEPRADVYIVPPLQQAGGDVLIHASFEDNHRVTDASFVIMQGQQTIATLDDFIDEGRGHYRLILAAPQSGQYTYTATAEDAKGHVTVTEGTFQVRSNALQLFDNQIQDGRLDVGDRIEVRLLEEIPVRSVYLDILNTGRRVNMTMNAFGTGWEASTDLAGWSVGNNTFRVVAETFTQWEGLHEIPPGQLVLPGPYHVEVTAPGNVQVPIPTDHLVPDNIRQVPGPSALLVIAGVLGIAAVVRRRRD
jgi:hypothetical protein